jgi:TPR repeat protein
MYDFAMANVELAKTGMKLFSECCGKNICGGCMQSFTKSDNIRNCPFCKAERLGKTDEGAVQQIMERVEANDAGAMCDLANHYYQGTLGLQQDRAKAMELFTKAAELGSSQAHYQVGVLCYEGGDMKKAKFHFEAAAIAGHEEARYSLGCMEQESGIRERAVKHWMIAASAGDCYAMHALRTWFEQDHVSRAEIDSTLAAYNNSCKEMRSEARDAYIHRYEQHYARAFLRGYPF